MGSGSIVASTEMTDQEASPEPTSGNDSIFGSEHQDDQHSADESTGPNSVKAEHDEEDASNSNSNPSMPMQKRRRVTRACDECRRKKIKCDGKQPCTHCSVYSYGESPTFLVLNFVLTSRTSQNVHTISPPTGGAIRRHSTSRHLRPS